MKKISPRKYLKLLNPLIKRFPNIFIDNYPIILISFILTLVIIWVGIFYQQAYRGIIDVPDGSYQRITIPEETITNITDEISRRKEIFTNPSQRVHRDPFR